MKQHLLLVAALIALAGAAGAEGTAVVTPPDAGSVPRAAGLAAWDRVYEVVSHPRCANCHVGPDNIPMWSGPSYGEARPHGMNINAGESRMGAEFVPCAACHVQRAQAASARNGAHEPPQVALAWQLAPVEFQWFGKSSAEVCAQMADPERTGGRDWVALAEHLRDDAGHGGFVEWGWNPGGGRDPAPYSLQAHIDDVLTWGAAGTPCEDQGEGR